MFVDRAVIEVTAGTGTNLTVTRGVDGTTALSHTGGAVVRLRGGRRCHARELRPTARRGSALGPAPHARDRDDRLGHERRGARGHQVTRQASDATALRDEAERWLARLEGHVAVREGELPHEVVDPVESVEDARAWRHRQVRGDE